MPNTTKFKEIAVGGFFRFVGHGGYTSEKVYRKVGYSEYIDLRSDRLPRSIILYPEKQPVAKWEPDYAI